MININKNNSMKGNGDEEEMCHLIDETATSVLRVFNAYGADGVQDWEVNELLEWTNNLSYDDYLLDWRTIGTSNSSNYIHGMLFELSMCNFFKDFYPYFVII